VCHGKIPVERSMTVLNRGQSTAEAEGAAGTESGPRQRAASRWRLPHRWLSVSLLAGALIAIGAGEFPKAADARGMSGGSISGRSFEGHASSSFGRSRIGFGEVNRHRFDSRRDRFFARDDFDRFHDFRRFRDRRRGEFGDGFFPFGFGDFGWGWPAGQTDLPVLGDGIGSGGDPGPPLERRLGRYEPPTTETTPSGVTIIRGPGSRH
jgi:hypothetical protein